MANFSLPWSHSFDNVRWALDTAVRKLSFSKEKLPNYWDSFCRPPRRIHRDVDVDPEGGSFFFLCLLLFKCCAQVSDFVAYLQKSFCTQASCPFREHIVCPALEDCTLFNQRIWILRYILSLSTALCLMGKARCRIFSKQRIYDFHCKCRVPQVGLGKHLLKGGGSVLTNGMKFNPTHIVYLKCFFKAGGDAKWHFKVSCQS